MLFRAPAPELVLRGGIEMSDYISRDAFKKKYLCCGYLPEMSEKEFDEFPAADVEPVRNGRWE